MGRRTTIGRAAAVLLATGASLGFASTAGAATLPDDFTQGQRTDTEIVAGSVQLERTAPTLTEGFSGPLRPTDWTETPWDPAGTTVFNNGATVNGVLLKSPWTAEAGEALEFEATFAAAPNQHVGLSEDYNGDSAWAMFSTKTGDGLYARTRAVSGEFIDVAPLFTVADPTASHKYRIERRATSVRFFVDGQLFGEDTTTPLPASMPVSASDFFPADAGLAIKSMSLSSPYKASGEYASRLLDGGDRFVSWQTLDTAPVKPAGTNVVLETRTRATAAGAPSAWVALGAGGDVASPDQRYLEYRASLSTTDVFASPALPPVSASFVRDESTPAPPAGGGGTTPPSGGGTGGGTPGGGTPGTGTPADTVAPQVKLKPATARVSSQRKVALKAKCPAGESSCRITVRLKRNGSTIARKTVVVPGGSTQQIGMKLSRSAYQSLAQRGSMRVSASATARDAAGNTATKTTTIKLLAPRG